MLILPQDFSLSGFTLPANLLKLIFISCTLTTCGIYTPGGESSGHNRVRRALHLGSWTVSTVHQSGIKGKLEV